MKILVLLAAAVLGSASLSAARPPASEERFLKVHGEETRKALERVFDSVGLAWKK